MNNSNSNSANNDIEFSLNSNNMQQQVKPGRTTINSAATNTSEADICDDDLSLYGMYVNEPSSHQQQQQQHHTNHQQQLNQQATITVIRGGGSNSNNNQNNKMQYLVRNESAIIMANSANNQYQQHQQQLDNQQKQQQQQQQQRSQLQNILQYNKAYKSTIIVPNSTSSATLTRISSANKSDCNVDGRCNQDELSDDEHEVDLSDDLTLNGKPSSPISHHQQSHNRRARRFQTRSPTLTSVYIEDFNCRSNRMAPITVIQAGIARGASTNNKNKHYHHSMNDLENGEASNEYITADEQHYQYRPSQSDATLSEHTNNRHRSQHEISQQQHRQVVTIIDEDNIVDDDVDDNDYNCSGNLSNFILKNSANEILIGCNNNVIDDDDDDIGAGGRRTDPGHNTNEIDIGDMDDDNVVHHHHHHHHHHDDLLVKDHSSNHLSAHNDCVEYLNDDLEDLKVMIVC